MNVVLRTTLPPAALSGTLERLVREVDPAVPIVRLRDMESVFAESIRRPRLLAQLLGTFAGLALLLAAVGTYGAATSQPALPGWTRTPASSRTPIRTTRARPSSS